MTAIQILQEAPQPGKLRYKAVFGRHHAMGATPGAALDALESALPTEAGTVVILQKFMPDRYFDDQQQARLAELMRRLQVSRRQGHALSPDEMVELEALIELELRATALRAEDVAAQIRGQ